MSREALAAVDAQRSGTSAAGPSTTVMDRVRQMYCGLHGHDKLLQFEQDRMYLKCVSCGHESPGWEIADTPPPVSVRSETRTHRPAALRPQLVDARRIA